jgi:ABC-type sugar transport system substrate-binding protein
MRNWSILLSLLTENNDFQRQQANAGKEAAVKAGVKLQIVFAENDAINQSQQLLKAIQSNENRPDGIAFEGVSDTGFPQVANAAVGTGIGWAVVNRDADYIQRLRTSAKAPVFAVSADQREAGRIQGSQLRAVMPSGGMALFIQGPSSSVVAQERTTGLAETKPENIQLRAMRGNWTEEGAYEAVTAWLRLSTSHNLPIGAVVAQNDSMAMGARKAFEDVTSGEEQSRWLSLPFFGCDGLSQTGQAWVRSGELTATIIHPTTAGLAVEMLARALETGAQPSALTLSAPTSFPEVERIGRSTTLAS